MYVRYIGVGSSARISQAVVRYISIRSHFFHIINKSVSIEVVCPCYDELVSSDGLQQAKCSHFSHSVATNKHHQSSLGCLSRLVFHHRFAWKQPKSLLELRI